MPLVAIAGLSYALGLLGARVLPGPAAAAAAGVLLLAGAVLVTRPVLAWPGTGTCALLSAAGALASFGARGMEESCMARIARARDLPASLVDDARPGGLARAVIALGECRVRATLLVASGGAGAGDRVLVRGAAGAGERGLLVRDAVITHARPTASLVSLRARAGRRIDRLFGADAPMVRALVIADMSAIPAEQRDRFARAGLVHMLSVSGLHVAIVALAFALLASALRIPRRAADAATLALLAAYVLLIGAPPPAVRAAVMLGLVLVSRAAQRPTSKWAVVAVGSALPLADPSVVVDLGWQLSVAGAIALVAGGALAARVVPRDWRGVRRGLARAGIVSVVATLATAPLVAWTFGRLAVLGPFTNLLADPVMGMLQPVLFLALCIPVAPVERITVDAAHVLLWAFDAIATRAAALPFAAPLVYPTPLAACAAGVAAVALVVACLTHRPARAAIVCVAALALMVCEPFLRVRAGTTELHMIDVGQGDALALRTRAGRWIVIDAGRAWRGGDAGARTVVPYLAHRGGDVALFVMSHPHADHVGGAASLLAMLHPARFLDPGYAGGSAPYIAALRAARREAIPWRRVHPGDSLVVDEAVVTMLAPDSAWTSALDDANLASAVMMIRVGNTRFLFTGDAEAAEEEWLLRRGPDALAADVLKVGHHGSRTSTTPAFLDAVRPRIALVSVGDHNTYGHPSAEVMAALDAAGASVLRTDRLGTVVVRTDGRSLEVEARGARWTVAPRAPR